jgi:hypothetical protein
MTPPERGRDGLRERQAQAICDFYRGWMNAGLPHPDFGLVLGVLRRVEEHPATGDEDYTTADAWEDNYRAMAARWAECDSERLALKEKLADAEMRLRLLASEPDPATGDEERGCRECGPGCLGHTTPPASDVYSDNAAAGGAEGLDELDALALAEEIWTEDEPNDAEQLLMQRVLTSDWLAAHDAQVKESAWDEGYCHAAESVCDERPSSTRDNPYRADRIEGTR